MMKQRMMLTVIVFLVLLGSVVIAQPSRPDSSQPHTVDNGVAVGGGYQLTGLVWQVTGTATGGNYRLLSPAAPTLRGSGCCCTYLPVLMRRFKR
jgi:hypothetical protein